MATTPDRPARALAARAGLAGVSGASLAAGRLRHGGLGGSLEPHLGEHRSARHQARLRALGVHSVREAIAIAAAVLACCFLVTAQRRLSTPVRQLRRRTVALEGEQRLADGTVEPLTRERLIAPLDGALKALSIAVPLLAVALLAIRA